jgi:outer membrane immunogenic protein
MRKFLLGTAALVALGSGVTANAAELAVRRPAVRVAAPVAYTNWTGCHLGGQIGDEWGRNKGLTTTGATTKGLANGAVAGGLPVTNGYDLNGFIGGFYGGCDYQFGAWVIGIEGDWSNLNKSGQDFQLGTILAPGWVNETQERWVATLRGRLGYAVDKWLLYVTGGVAWARIDSSQFLITGPGPVATALLQTDTRTGWTIGVGTEYAVGWGWSARTQYLFVDIPSYTTFTPGIGSGLNSVALTNLDNGPIYNHILTAGLTYKFGYYGAR